MESVSTPRETSGANLAELERTYRERYPDLLRAATAISGSAESGRDAVHDAFVSLIRARKTYRQDGHLDAWVWAAVVNAARRETRRRSSLPLAEESLNGSAPHAEDGGGQDAVRAAISRLPERQKLALFLRYYADLDYAAIAEALGTAPGTIAAAIYAAHKTLRRALQEVETNV
jgi:RNA polymerase sigma factor (sigma-70 family)